MLKPKKKRQNKSAWIRQQDMNLPAAEIVKKAKAEGIDIGVQRVYAIRSVLRSPGLGPKRGPGRPPRGASLLGLTAKGSSTKGDSKRINQEFVHLVASLGLLRAEQLFAGLRSKLGALDLGG